MDEIIEFIKSLNGINADNIHEHAANFGKLIKNNSLGEIVNIIITDFNISFQTLIAYNIYIIADCYNGSTSIEVLVNDRYISANLSANGQFNSLTGILNNPKQNVKVVQESYSLGEIIKIKTDDLIVTDDKCNIDWLLGLKSIKSAK